ncbi:DNA glycosylase [Byssothecium circinans]|uniref:DNA glycosylase n=1 Tax=Byssothecium circinans TaxID=147558 RepID=A0A6A5T9J8_9PLEO|nr:DNA glycosylase [Byssothecium circinans]
MARTTTRSAFKSGAQPIQDPVQLSSPPATPGSRNNDFNIDDMPEPTPKKRTPRKVAPATPKSSRKRTRAAVIKNEAINELPHNLGKIPENLLKDADVDEGSPAKKPRRSRVTTEKVSLKKADVDDLVDKALTTPKSPRKSKKKAPSLTPGESPYPNWPHPTPEECHEVNRLLSTIHGEVKPPETIPLPSLTVAGCGEVPSVLDALIRTVLSAATSGTNSSRAFAGLVKKFGILEEGIGQGSVDWNKVRLAETSDIFDAIKSGGLAKDKSKNIKTILEMVWQENQTRRDQLVASSSAPGSEKEGPQEKDVEIAKADEGVISLDHLHLLDTDEAFQALMKYPGVGVKTSACVLLFCLRRPCFAVDTHVFRLCQWLGWVPPPGDPAGLPPGTKRKFTGPSRDSTYSHCQVRVPDELKYPLHQLFIMHGKTCPRCRAITGENSEGWDEGCVIDHLVKRTGVRKGLGASPMKGGKARNTSKASKIKSKAKSKEVEESDAESSELSDVPDEEEEDTS